MNQVDIITFRRMSPEDETFSYQVYASTRADEMNLVNWSVEQKEAFLQMQFRVQKQHFEANYPMAEYQIIECAGQPAGRLILDRSGESTLLVDIALLPVFRGAGVGSGILRNIQSEGKKITLHVFKLNPAKNLYQRLGFVFVNVDEDDFYPQMTWFPEGISA